MWPVSFFFLKLFATHKLTDYLLLNEREKCQQICFASNENEVSCLTCFLRYCLIYHLFFCEVYYLVTDSSQFLVMLHCQASFRQNCYDWSFELSCLSPLFWLLHNGLSLLHTLNLCSKHFILFECFSSKLIQQYPFP